MGRNFYVAPDGDDSHPGTPDAPFATLPRARAAVRDVLATDPATDIRVTLHGGVYRLAETLVLGPQDSPAPGARVTWAAAPGESPVLSAACPVTEWRELADPPPGLPEPAHGKVYVADVEPGRRFCALFDAEGLLTRAHSPDILTADTEEAPPTTDRVRFHPGVLRDWSNLEDIELLLTPLHPWVVNYVPLESVDTGAGVARLAVPTTYPATTQGHGPDIFCRVENAIDWLDGPGRWVLDSRAGRLYLWPRTPGPEGILAPRLTELVRIEGDFENVNWARNITLDGLTFSHGDRWRWPAERRSLQHDWEHEDAPNCLVRLRGAESVHVRNCRVLDSGSGGIRLDLHATDNLVKGNEIARVGGTGIALIGYGPGTRDENHHNEVSRNHIHHAARLWWQNSGIFIAQSGHNLIRDNLIHNMPYNGLTVSGLRTGVFSREEPRVREGHRTIRWDEIGETPIEWHATLAFKHARHNVIEHNEIHHTMERLGDGNGIYLSGTGEANVVRRNFVHDIEGSYVTAGIRNDDEQFLTLVTENVICRINAAAIISKNINQIENNIAVDCYVPGDESRGFAYLSVRHRGPCYGTGVRRNIFYRPADGHPNQRPFVEMTDLFSQVAFDDNVLYCEADPDAAQAQLDEIRALGKAARCLVADPRFIDAASDDYRLAADSPALRLGIRPIERWGLTHTPGPERT